MSSSKNITAAKKAEIIEKALAEIKNLAEKHNISEEEIRSWVQEANDTSVTEVSLDVSEEFAGSVEYGAAHDHLNFSKLTFWSVFGTASVIIFVVAVMFMYEFTRTASLQAGSEQSIFFDIQQLQQSDEKRLSSFGVVDPDEGIYHIPIESAIDMIVTD